MENKNELIVLGMEGKRSRKTENIQQISSISVIPYIFRLVGRITN